MNKTITNDNKLDLTSITVSDTAVFEGQVSITDTTNSTSSTTGALTVGGGVGINNRLVVGGDIEGSNDLFLGSEIRLGTYETVIKTTNGLLGAARCITIGSDGSSGNMNNTAARNDIVIGLDAGMAITSGKSNICLGSDSGNTITTQPDNICIGGDADVSTTSITNTISIGRTALSESSNQTTIGNASMATIRAGADNVCDLGESGRQFKDLYLGSLILSKSNVTQTGTVFTGVTVSGNSGIITTLVATLNPDSKIVIPVTTGSDTTAKQVIVTINNYAGAGGPQLTVKNKSATGFDVVIFNAHSTIAMGSTMEISYLII